MPSRAGQVVYSTGKPLASASSTDSPKVSCSEAAHQRGGTGLVSAEDHALGPAEPLGRGLEPRLVLATPDHQDLALLAEHRRGCFHGQVDPLVRVQPAARTDHVRVRGNAAL